MAARVEGASVGPDRWMLFLCSAISFAGMALALHRHGFAGDLLMDIVTGQYILHHHSVPMRNWFTYADHGKPWPDTEWLFSLSVAALYEGFGRIGVYLAFLPWLALLAVWMARLALGAGPLAGLSLTALASAALAMVMSPRPQILSYVLFGYGLYAVERARTGADRHLFVFAATTILWANLHQSVFLAPLLLLGGLLLDDRLARRRYLGPALLACLLAFAHPGLFHVSATFLGAIFRPGVLGVLDEWKSPNFQSVSGLVILPWVLLPLSWNTMRAWQRRDGFLLALSLCGPLAVLFAVRFLPYDVLATLFAFAKLAPSRLKGIGGGLKWVPAAALLSLILVDFGRQVATSGLFPVNGPLAAVAYLKRQRATNVLAPYADGDVLEFYGVEPFLDGKAELWSRERWWPEYVLDQCRQTGMARFATAWDPSARWILWPDRPSGCMLPLRSPGWRRVYVDRRTGTAVWRRLGPEGGLGWPSRALRPSARGSPISRVGGTGDP